MTQQVKFESSTFEELILPNSVKTPNDPDLPTVDCLSEWHEDVSQARMLREGQKVVVLLYRTDDSNAWTVETIRCIRCGTSFPSYEDSLVPESEVAVVTGTLTPTESERALQLTGTMCVDSYVVKDRVDEDSTREEQPKERKVERE
jgi:hypothetical protein